MAATTPQLHTSIDEIAEGIFRINTPVNIEGGPGGFSFNQYLVVDNEPMLYHAGPRKMFPAIREALETVLPAERLRYITLSHVEADECGALNDWLEAAPNALPLCGKIAALVSVNDLADRPPRALAHRETISLGSHTLRWFDAPHLPHAWDCGFLMDETAETLLCGDLFTQPGHGQPALTHSDILGPTESLRKVMDYYSHTTRAGQMLQTLADTKPGALACMHGSAWEGNGHDILLALADALEQ